MKLLKYFGFVFILLFSLISVNAVTLNNSEVYYSFDVNDTTGTDMGDLSGNGNNGTCSGMTNCNTVEGLLNNASNFDNTDDMIDMGSALIPASGAFSISMWVNPTNCDNEPVISQFTAGQTGRLSFFLSGGGTCTFRTFVNGVFDMTTSQTFDAGSWSHVVVTFDSTSNASIYYNGTYLQSTTDLGGSVYTGTNTKLGFSDVYLGGKIDETAIYTRVLNASEITQLYNGGEGFNPYAEVVISTPTLTIDNINLVNGTITNQSSLDIALNITNTSTNNLINTTLFLSNGSSYQIGTNTQNVTYTLNNIAEGVYNIWTYSFNNETNVTSSNFTYTFDFTPPVINSNISTEYNFYEINFSEFINVSDDLNLTSCVLSFSTGPNSDCDNQSYTFVQNGNISFNITATDTANNTAVLTNNTILINPFVLLSVQESGSPLTNFTFGGRSDVNGTVTYTIYNDGLVLGNNTLEFQKLGYQTQSFSFELNTTSQINETFNVSQAEIIVTIYDRETGAIVSGPNFQLEFIATVGLVTNTTTGTATITNVLFQSETYQLVTSANNYTTEQLFFDFTNQESLSLDIYTTNTSDLARGVVEIKVVDKFGKSITGAIGQALQWDSNTSSYVKVSEGLTAEDGKTLLNVILDTKQYIFQASFGDLAKNTSPQFIPELLNGKTITISLDLGPTEFEGFLENINYDITETFNGSISNITLDWETTDGTSVEGCIIYSRVQPSGTRTELSEDCSTGSSNILLVSKQLNSSYYIEARVGFKIGGLFYNQKTFTYPPAFDISNILKETNLAYFILPLFYLIVVLIGMANVFIGAVLLLIVNGLGLWIVPQFLTPSIVAFFYFIGIVLMIAGSKRK